jgi:probable phosphoglycerate mutase
VAAATGLAVEIIDDFAECSFGDWDGFTFTEVRTRWPNEMQEWLASTSVAPPGGESFDQCRDRVDRARKEVLARYPGEHVLVVAHVSPIKLLVGLAIDAPLHSVYRMELRPCSITSLAWFPEGNASMFSFSESSHLRGVEVPDGT